MNHFLRLIWVCAPLLLSAACMSANNNAPSGQYTGAPAVPGYGNNNGGYVLADNPYNDPYGSPYGASAYHSPAPATLRAAPQNAYAGYNGSGYAYAPQSVAYNGRDMPLSSQDAPDTGLFSWMKKKVTEKISGDSGRAFSEWFKERMTPRPMKRQLFGTPNAVNQFGEGQNEYEAMREIRNGTRKVRMKERVAYGQKAYAQNIGQYRAQYDAPKPEGSSYGQGFEDGCKTFMSAVGKGVWRVLDHKRIDVQRYVKDNWYLRGYNDGADFCTSRTDWDMH